MSKRVTCRLTCVVAVFSAMLALGACGYRPLYGTGSYNPQVNQHLHAIAVNQIPDRVGQMLRTSLLHKLRRTSRPVQPAYTLHITLSEGVSYVAIAKNAFATRANLILSATYQLRRSADGALLYDGSAKSISSYNIVSSDYATLKAQEDARESAATVLAADLYTLLGAYFQRPTAGQPLETDKKMPAPSAQPDRQTGR